MKIKYLLAVLPLFALAGCSQDTPKFVDLNLKYITAKSAPVSAVDQRSQAQLAETAQSVNQSMQQLSAIQIATHPTFQMPTPFNAVKIGMAQQTSLDWTGPVEPLLKKIAAASGYQLQVLGKTPAIPIIVIINAYNEPLADILRDTIYQIAQRARVKLYPQNKVIELRYLPS